MAGVVSSARTFSMSTWGGRRVSMARTISDQRPDWVPGRSPSRVPAAEMSVQGKPPHRRSMGLIPQRTRDQLMRRTSPRLGTPGQCLARMTFAAGSVSQCHTTVPPVACSTARSSMPLPENMLPILTRSAPPHGVHDHPGRYHDEQDCVYRYVHLSLHSAWGCCVLQHDAAPPPAQVAPLPKRVRCHECAFTGRKQKNRRINAGGVQQVYGGPH